MDELIITIHLRNHGIKLEDGYYKIDPAYINQEFLNIANDAEISYKFKKGWYFFCIDDDIRLTKAVKARV